MQVFQLKKDLKEHLSTLESKNYTIGMVPTMGALHQGHISLVQKAAKENDFVVISIFVNPTQFNNKEDLEKYPQTLDKDVKLLEEAITNGIVFAPSAKEIYPEKIEANTYNFGPLEHVMEGAFRPGHFDGVGTIVELLLTTVMPRKAYFGEKDFQQLQIIKKLVQLKKIPIAIIGCPILREENGLAMSSRNERLSSEDRQTAGFIYKSLKTAKEKFGTKSAQYIKNWVRKEFDAQPDFKLEYIEISDAKNLTPVKRKQKEKKYRAFIAVYMDDVRLIDNIALN